MAVVITCLTQLAADLCDSQALKVFPVHSEMMDKWLKKPTLSPNIEQLVQNEFTMYSNKTHDLNSRLKTLYGESVIYKFVKIEAP